MSVEVLGIVVALVALSLTVLGLYLALKTGRQLYEVHRLTDDAGELLRQTRSELAAFDAGQTARMDRVDEQLGTVIEAVASVAPQPDETEIAEIEQTGGASAEDIAEYARMEAVEPADLPEPVRDEVRRQSDSELQWALRRRGPGRPRWLVATAAEGPWRVTIRNGQPHASEVPWLADQVVKPVRLANLGPGAIEALSEATGLDPAELPETGYHRVRPGAPVYFVVIHAKSEVWRLVKTRWGWSAVPEDGA